MNQPSNTPWWLPSDEVKQVRVVQTKSNSNFIIFAVVIALVAGALGAMVGRSSSTNIGANQRSQLLGKLGLILYRTLVIKCSRFRILIDFAQKLH